MTVDVVWGTRKVRLGSGLALVALSVVLILTAPLPWNVVGWVLLILMAFFDLFG